MICLYEVNVKQKKRSIVLRLIVVIPMSLISSLIVSIQIASDGHCLHVRRPLTGYVTLQVAMQMEHTSALRQVKLSFKMASGSLHERQLLYLIKA